jgi:nucleotide-binding universal stress UspA family protein
MRARTLSLAVGSDDPLDNLEKLVPLCEKHEIHLAVTVLGISVPVSTSAFSQVPSDIWSIEYAKGQEDATKQSRRVEDILQKAGISGDVISYYADLGQIPHIAGLRGRFADLALLPAITPETETLMRAVAGGLFHESGKPVLHLPDGVTPTLKPTRILVAWNSTREAARATGFAMEMLAEADKVHIALVDPEATEYQQGEEPGYDIGSYLSRHGVDPTIDVLASGGRNTADVLRMHATDIGADFIVAGAYGHSKLREFLFGSTTQDLLSGTEHAVYLAH